MDRAFVVDNSVVMTWCFGDEIVPYTDAVLDRLTEAVAYVPSIWPLEVVNVLLVAERRKRISYADATRFIALLGDLPIEVVPDESENVMPVLLAIGRSNQLSGYDAAYLNLAMKKQCPIATLDKNLVQAAKSVGVPLLVI